MLQRKSNSHNPSFSCPNMGTEGLHIAAALHQYPMFVVFHSTFTLHPSHFYFLGYFVFNCCVKLKETT